MELICNMPMQNMIVENCTVRYCTVQYSTVHTCYSQFEYGNVFPDLKNMEMICNMPMQNIIVENCTVQHSTVNYSTVQYSTVNKCYDHFEYENGIYDLKRQRKDI